MNQSLAVLGHLQFLLKDGDRIWARNKVIRIPLKAAELPKLQDPHCAM